MKIEVGCSLGRCFLQINDVIVIVEGDPNRNCEAAHRFWTREAINDLYEMVVAEVKDGKVKLDGD